MACEDSRQLTEAQRQAAYQQQRTGVPRAIRPFTGNATLPNLIDYINRELMPAVKAARSAVNDVYLQVADNAPSANPLGYFFSTETGAADPTTGRVRLNQATQNTSTVLRISQTNGRLADVLPWLEVMSGSVTEPLGVVTLADAVNPGRFLRADLDTMTDQGAYWDLGITITESSHPNPFVEGEGVTLAFIPGVADNGGTGAQIPPGSISPIASDTFLGNISGSPASPVAVPLADVDSTSVVYDAASHTFQRAALTGFATASQNGNATSSAEPIVTFSASANMSNERVATSSTSVAVSTSVASQIEFQRAALTGAVTASQNSNATLFDTNASGAGLTGGGTAVLAVGAGDGITVNANDVAVNVSDIVGSGVENDGSNNIRLTRGRVTITGTVNAAALAADTVALETSGSAVLNGIANGFLGRAIDVYCGGNHTLTVNHASASAASTDQILLSNAVAYGPTTRGGIRLRHDGSLWREVARAGLGDGEVTLPKLANQADDTFLANISGASGPPTAVALTTLAGAGLTGGADAILAVGAGTHVTVNANDVAVNVSTLVAAIDSASVVDNAGVLERAALTGAVTAAQNSNATLFDTNASGAGLTGGGSAVLAVGAGTGITVNANDVQLTTIADDTFMANVSGGAAVATGKTFTSLGGDGIDYNATTHALDVAVSDFAGSGLENDGSNNLRLTRGRVTITGTVNAAALAADTVALETSGSATLNGISGGFAGRVIDVYCGGNHTLTVNHNSGSAASTDVMLLTNAVAYGPATRGGMRLRHDGSVWREVSRGGLEDGVVTTAKILDASVTLAKQANLAESRIVGRAEGAGTGVPQALTPTQVVSIIDGESPTWTGVHRHDTYIQFDTSTGLPSSGDIRKAASLRVESSNNVDILAGVDVSLNGTDDVSLLAGDLISLGTSGDITLNAGTVHLNGRTAFTDVQSSASTSINNLALTGNVVRLSGTAWSLTGMVPDLDGQVVLIVNESATTGTIQGEDGASTAANRFAGIDRAVLTGQLVVAWYNGTLDRWCIT